uniref:Murinoglobulin 1 n=1 Tax=Cavia porcellus TaxID=10141 RepID=H0W8R4_CAVPO
MGKGRHALPHFVLIFLALLMTAASVHKKPQYMVLVPTQLYTEVPEKSCLHLHYLKETVTVSASLMSSMGKKSLFSDFEVHEDLFQCVSFTLPRTSSPNEVAFLSVQIKGRTHTFSEEMAVVVRNTESILIVQTDKPMYKPGQTVKFRVVSVDRNLRQRHELVMAEGRRKKMTGWTFNFNKLGDPRKNRIMQWRDITSENGIKQLSFNLSSEPIQGFYKIMVLKKSGEKKEHVFSVEEYVLPRFEVQVKCPKAVTFLDEKVNVTVFNFAFFLYKLKDSHIFKMFKRLKFQCLTFVFLFSFIVLLQFRLEDVKGVPVADKHIFLKVFTTKYNSSATTDEHGLVEFSINTTDIVAPSLTFKVYYKEQGHCFKHYCIEEELKEVDFVFYSVFSYSKSFVYLEPVTGALPCGQMHTVHVHYTLNGKVLGELREMVFYYLIMARGIIVQTGTHAFFMEPGELKGYFNLSIPIESYMAPAPQMLIYAILPSGEVIADSAKFEIENCLLSQVGLSFRPAQSLPASQTHLRVTAPPQSLCALRAVDQSVLLMRPEAELSPSSIYNLLSIKDTDSSSDLNWLANFPENCKDINYDKIKYSSLHRNDKDTFKFIESMGLNIFTNLKIRDPNLCPDDLLFPQAVAIKYTDHTVPAEVDEKPLSETVRTYFPETWIWDLVEVNSSGVAEVAVTVPDTITEWKAGALCLPSDTGLGLSPTASLRAFQPFFVELTMPYSVVRGEVFTFKATVLNYLSKCIQVSVQLEASPAFTAVPLAKDQDSYCLCEDGRQTVSWLVTPKALGNVNFSVSAETQQPSELCGTEVAAVPEARKKDTVVKPLLVEPEGIKKEYMINSFLCASDAVISEKLSLKLPPKLVTDSARAFFSVFGDILSSSIKNTQNLLQMPYGCGEQNMVLFAPNIYVLKYLNETDQLTQEIKSKAIGYLSAGYQRQLNYKHPDGSYSAFGHQNGRNQGNTWLTAFVLKTLAQARAFIFIDETHISHAFTWLSQKQKDNGCFRSSGTLFHNDLKGGVDDEVTLSAYITIALLEMPLPATHPVVSKALTCLNESLEMAKEGSNGSYVYTKALLAYAFALAGNQDKRKEILKSLDEEAVKEDNSIHWERPQKPRRPEALLYQPQAPSAEVEMTSYVLLAHLTAQGTPTPEEMTSAMRIVNWITKQQNSYGGFSSTQDTVVALHALSRYGAATFGRTGKTALVKIQSSGTFSTKFQVDNSNRLLLQQYTISVSGEGCVYTQKEKYAFALQVHTVPQTCDDPKAHKRFQISLEVSYTGRRPASNMAIVNVKMISGFSPLKSTVKMLERSDHVSRTEVNKNNVLIYVDQVTNETLNFSFAVLQDVPVRNLKPAFVKVYDYYETGEAAFAEYSAPCSTDTEE